MDEKEFNKKAAESDENFTADNDDKIIDQENEGFLEETEDATAFFDMIDKDAIEKLKEVSRLDSSAIENDDKVDEGVFRDDEFTGNTMTIEDLIPNGKKSEVIDEAVFLNMDTTVSDIVLPESKKEEKFSFMKEFFDFIEMIVFSVLFVIFVFTFIGRNVVVDGDSMENTLYENDVLIITNLTQNFDRGDIIVFLPENPQGRNDLNKPFIKRVIAVENDVIDIDENEVVYINGEAIDEPYLKANMREWNKGSQEYPFTVPENYLFVMGDNREVSWDSRSTVVGIVDKRTVMGKVVLRLFPFSGFGTVE